MTIKDILKKGFIKPKKTPQSAIKEISVQLVAYGYQHISKVLAKLETHQEGLTEEEVARRLSVYGPNEISHKRPPSWYYLLLKNFKNPFIALIVGLGVISFFLKEYNSVLIIAFMVLVSVVMRFIQEYRSNEAAEKLKALVSTKATVIRNLDGKSKSSEIDIKYIVPGDIIHLSAGDMLPADVKIISAKGLYLSQSSLTGESLPVEKDERLKPKEDETNPIDMPDLCFAGTSVVNGTANAVVLHTGDKTYFGAMAQNILGARPLTSFDIGVNRVSWLLIRFIFVMAPFIFFINGFSKGDWFEAFLFAVSVAIGLTPEMLPMIVTANLARGAVKMSDNKVVVKRLNAIQNFGAMDVLCTDKTGTLTQDRIILEKHLDAEGKENEEVLFYGYLNSFYQTGLKNLLDIAVLEHTEIEERLRKEAAYKKVDEIPFDFTRRRMSVVIEKTPHEHLLICKGAVEEIFAHSTCVKRKEGIVPLEQAEKEKLEKIKKELNVDGLRVLAVAYKEVKEEAGKNYQVEDECDLIFLGYLAFLDPPKLSAKTALAKLSSYAVKVKVLTGDNELVTQKICKWVGLDVEGVILGSQVEKLSEEELKITVEKMTIFAKLTPLQKARVIASLKSNGHTVGFLGDGINDAPALCEADIGISVDTAVDIAKESADIIMLEKSLLFLGEGVLEGRRTFGNIIKYIKMALSSNFGNVFSIVGASLIFPFLPLLPVQLLLQNLLYDLSQVTIPFDNVDKEFLVKPRSWNPAGILKFVFFIGPISSIFDYVLFTVMWFVFAANTPENQSLFQSGWFIEGLLSQTLIVHMIRTQKIPFIQSRASAALLFTTLLVMLIGIYIPYSAIGASIGLVPLPGNYFYWLFSIVLSYCLLTQLVKVYFVKKYRYWLA